MHFKIEIKTTGTVLTSQDYDPTDPEKVKFVESVMNGIASNQGGWVKFRIKNGASAVLNYDNVTHAVFYGLPD